MNKILLIICLVLFGGIGYGQYDSIVKVVQGWIKIKGATDGTLIGNVGDRLKVDNLPTEIKGGTDGTVIGNVDDNMKVFIFGGSEDGLIVIDHALQALHDGLMYHHSGDTSLGRGDEYAMVITTPAAPNRVYLTFRIKAEDEAFVKLYEDPTGVVKGALIPVYNRNRQSANTSVATLNLVTSYTTLGLELLVERFEKASQSTEQSRSNVEWELDVSTEYIIFIESESPGNEISWGVNWYIRGDE